MSRSREHGIAFLSVLATLAIGASLVLGMQQREEGRVSDVDTHATVLQAQQIVGGALLAVQVALEKDGQKAPDIDHYGEEWYQTRQEETAISGGTLSVTLADLGGLLDVNGLSDQMALATFERALRASDLDPGLAGRIASFVRQNGPIDHLTDLPLAPADRQALSQIAVALPQRVPVNLNTAPAPVLSALFPQSGMTRRILAVRQKTGQITAQDLRRIGALPPPNAGWDTRHVRATATVRFEGLTLKRSIDLARDERNRAQVSIQAQQQSGR